MISSALAAAGASTSNINVTYLLVTAGGFAAWLLVVGAAFLLRRTWEPNPGPSTMDLGPEPPALVNLLTHGFSLTRDAVPATLLDLAARHCLDLDQVGVGDYVCRLRTHSQELLPYEARVLDVLESRAVDGVIPARALTTGPSDESTRWWKHFTKEVVADAQQRQLTTNLWSRGVIVALFVLAVPLAVPAFLAGGMAPVYWTGIAVVAVLGWLSSSSRQRALPAGCEVASRWLGVRDHLEHDEVFPTLPPAAVAIWDRYLAYGAALGVAAAAVRAVPMGAEDDHRAWSSAGARWRQVRVRYPRFLPPAWGRHPVGAFFLGLFWLVLAGTVFSFARRIGRPRATEGSVPPLTDSVVAWIWRVELAVVVLFGLAALWGLYVVVRAVPDFWQRGEITGQAVRLRKRRRGGNDDNPTYCYYVAVDDGSSETIRAFQVGSAIYEAIDEYDEVTGVYTPQLRHVRTLQRLRKPAVTTSAAGRAGTAGAVP